MSSTASVVELPRNDNTIRGQTSGQCTPLPLPALGTQKIIQGNGTSVGTVISLHCPDRHRPVGQRKCVWDSNSTQWSGDTPWCEPLPLVDNYGFRVAVLASVVSSVIILFMSMAFITCCVVDCIKKTERKKREREESLWQHQQESRSSHYHQKGRNKNNNNKNNNNSSNHGNPGRNTNNNNSSRQDKDLPPWLYRDSALGDFSAWRLVCGWSRENTPGLGDRSHTCAAHLLLTCEHKEQLITNE